MKRRQPAGRPLRLAAGFAVGCAIGTALLVTGMVASAVDAQLSPRSGVTGLRDVLHTPPLVVTAGERVSLRYETVCQADERGKPCTIRGTLFVREPGDRAYTRIAMALDGEFALSGRLDESLTDGTGVEYYAVIEDGLGGTRVVPAAGATAPQRVWVASRVRAIDLGTHVFGATRMPDRRVLTAAWGSGRGELGLLTGRALVRIGPSAFDVAPDGTVVVLDQVNDRLARYAVSGARPTYVPVAFAGGEGDLAVDADGVMHVLDHGPEAVIRSYARSGSLLGRVLVDAHSADMLRAGPTGPLVHGYPGDRWIPVRQGGVPLQPAEQVARAQSGRAVDAGVEVLVRAGPRAATFALARGDRVLRAWRVTSTTELGEVQLAEPLGDGLLVVVRVWTQTEAEFVALVLPAAGDVRSFSIDAVEWAESSALSRFRIDGATLYQLRSAPAGADVVTFDVGGAQ